MDGTPREYRNPLERSVIALPESPADYGSIIGRRGKKRRTLQLVYSVTISREIVINESFVSLGYIIYTIDLPFSPSPEEIEFDQFKRSFSVSIEIFSTITEEVEGGRARAVSAGSSEEIQRTGRGGLSVPS